MSTSSRPVVVGIGEVLWDLLPSGKQLGGAVMNFAYHAQALGAEGIVVSCVGDDELGHEILARLNALGMSREFVAIDPNHPTGTVDVAVDEKGVPTFTIHQDVAWDFIPCPDKLIELARRADAICFGTLAQRSAMSRAAIDRILAAARRECIRIFDINLRQSYYSESTIEVSLKRAQVLKLNDQELPVLSRMLKLPGEPVSAMRELAGRYGLCVIALTRGAGGSLLYVQGRLFEHPGYPADVVDTVGAGDAFTAALAVGLLRGEDPQAINDKANRLASFVCTQAGATPAIPGGMRG